MGLGVVRLGEQGYVRAVWGRVRDHTNRHGENKRTAWQSRGADGAGARRGIVEVLRFLPRFR